MDLLKLKDSICFQFYESLYLKGYYDKCKLTISKDRCEFKEPILFIPTTQHGKQESCLEIILFKSTLLNMFCTSHDYWKDRTLLENNNNNNNNNSNNAELFYNYIMTLGFLIGSYDEHTFLRLHEDIFFKLLTSDKSYFENSYLLPASLVQKEIYLVELLLSSNQPRINKSSILWKLYQKLYVLQLFYYPNTVKLDYLDTCLSSAEAHFSNYYCWNSLKWFSDNAYVKQSKRFSNICKIKEFCLRNLRDNSAWYCYSYLLIHINGDTTYNCRDFQRLYTKLASKMGTKGQDLANKGIAGIDSNPVQLDLRSEINAVIDLINNLRVPTSPQFNFLYYLLLNGNEEHMVDTKLLAGWESEVCDFENKFMSLELKHCDPPEIHDSYNNDLKFISEFQFMYHLKYFLHKYKAILKLRER
ncbi:uncharacterized protein SCODWIG_02797 [Saccharomycodes ludwigii]|uniref:Protein ECM9 n=1 Tax=Saccharomycodes ludwigii TaxID=36035 RepID=A0A376B8N5_9ASCO|nr:hypothetical protein SCDLUD_004089 [Saccharomycodes ludwigii]KAH3899796.1 hypothetical protein SCDLUD_004089 [Saccharomycodes ludwigii]SSD61036.1 uncharacterized protein SCODWIG_02797 [Saccharomycodes ludwigii]